MRLDGLGYRYSRPSINRSSYDCTVENGAIRIGLKYVAELLAAGIQGIIQTRGEDGPFRSMGDCLHRTRLPSAPITNLIRVGDMDSLGERRDEMIRQDLLADRLKGRTVGTGQIALFPDSSSVANLVTGQE